MVHRRLFKKERSHVLCSIRASGFWLWISQVLSCLSAFVRKALSGFVARYGNRDHHATLIKTPAHTVPKPKRLLYRRSSQKLDLDVKIHIDMIVIVSGIHMLDITCALFEVRNTIIGWLNRAKFIVEFWNFVGILLTETLVYFVCDII